ncbi:interleukin-15 receptor subunit alpha isoform X2 [Chanodichthys erythropterus]|uniref:interleukin-15 receptor subunit alpha isoform X2 n=1 Tax=Chanodichthys erythropterus TaxID=933992 RepID=UPI00351ECB9C
MLQAESDVSTQHKCRTSLRGVVISYTFVWIYPSAFHLNSPGHADMHVLLILIFMTAANQHNFARASGFCRPPEIANTVPVHETYPINKTIRLQCVEGYVRKAGTSNQIRCTEKDGKTLWDHILNFECIPDPRKPNVPKTHPTTQHVTKTDPTTPHVTKTETQMPHFTSSTTESTEIKISTVLGTSMPTTATGHITLTTTNEVVTTKTRRTTSQPTLKSTTKEAESITTTNEITSSTSSSFTSRDYMTATSSHSSSSSFTTKTETKMEATFSNFTSTVSGVTSIIIICLAAAVFLLWWRWRHRERSDRNGIQLYHNVCTSEHCSTDPNTAANNPTTVSVIDTNQPQTGSLNVVDTSDKLLPQTDSC